MIANSRTRAGLGVSVAAAALLTVALPGFHDRLTGQMAGQALAMSLAAPLVTSGSACSTLTAERANTGRSVSPSACTGVPRGSTTTSAPRCADSMMPPRVASTRTGFMLERWLPTQRL